MRKIIKNIIGRIILSIIPENWNNSGALKVLINTNKYFTREKWRKALINSGLINFNEIDIIYLNKKYKLLKHFNKADFCFVFGYNRAFNFYAHKKKLIYIPSLGLDYIDKNTLPENFLLKTPPPVSAKAIAEYCLSMIIIFNRNMQYAFFKQQKRIWDQSLILKENYSSVTEKIIGIMGVGKVGICTAELLQHSNFSVYGLDKIQNHQNKNIKKWFSLDAIEEFLKSIDILIVALPLNNETKGLIGLKELKILGHNSFIINISRGDIIVEKDLFTALNNKIIKGAVIDTFSKEPLKYSNKFYRLNNIIITPHIAGNINMFVDDIQKDFISNISENINKWS